VNHFDAHDVTSPDWRTAPTGLATLRRDGFASMDAGVEGGTLTTRLVRFRGRYLFVNAAIGAGELRVEALDEAGQVIAPFSEAHCVPLRGNGTRQAVRWRGARDLSELAGRPVRFRFHLRNGELYAFWVSPERSGASHGYVAAGGPGYTGPTDEVGSAAPGVLSRGWHERGERQLGHRTEWVVRSTAEGR